jgi:hypothetical protein
VRAAHREDVRTDCIRFSPIKEFRAQWPDVSV